MLESSCVSHILISDIPTIISHISYTHITHLISGGKVKEASRTQKPFTNHAPPLSTPPTHPPTHPTTTPTSPSRPCPPTCPLLYFHSINQFWQYSLGYREKTILVMFSRPLRQPILAVFPRASQIDTRNGLAPLTRSTRTTELRALVKNIHGSVPVGK